MLHCFICLKGGIMYEHIAVKEFLYPVFMFRIFTLDIWLLLSCTENGMEEYTLYKAIIATSFLAVRNFQSVALFSYKEMRESI